MKKILLLLLILPALMQAQLPSYSNPFTVDVAATGNVNLGATSSTTIDGQGFGLGDPVTALMRFQNTPAQNGIYSTTAGTSAWTRIAAADTYSELEDAFVSVSSGTTYAGTTFHQGLTGGTINSDPLEFLFASDMVAGQASPYFSICYLVGDGSTTQFQIYHLHGVVPIAPTIALGSAGSNVKSLFTISNAGMFVDFDTAPAAGVRFLVCLQSPTVN